MTKRWKTTVLAGAAIAVIGVATMSAQGRGRGGQGGFQAGQARLGPLAGLRHGMRALDLTEAQRDQIKTALQQHREEFKALAERGKAAHKELRTAIASDGANEQLIREKSAAVAAVQADAAVLGGRVRGEVFSLLTPEQQAKAKELRGQAGGRRQERRGRIKERLQQRFKQPLEDF